MTKGCSSSNSGKGQTSSCSYKKPTYRSDKGSSSSYDKGQTSSNDNEKKYKNIYDYREAYRDKIRNDNEFIDDETLADSLDRYADDPVVARLIAEKLRNRWR